MGISAIFDLRSVPTPGQGGAERTTGSLAGLGRGSLLHVFLVSAATTTAAGVIVTFLSLAVASGSGVFSAAGALLVVGIVSRWSVGGAFRRSPRPTPSIPRDYSPPRSRWSPSRLERVADRRGSALRDRLRAAPESRPAPDDGTCLGERRRVGKHAVERAFDVGTGLGAFLWGIPLGHYFSGSSWWRWDTPGPSTYTVGWWRRPSSSCASTAPRRSHPALSKTGVNEPT